MTNDNIATAIGERLRRHREIIGMKVNQLARQIGASRNTVTNYEAGKTVPGAADLIKIARVLGCTLNELVGNDDAAEQNPRFAFRAHRRIEKDPDIRVAARRFLRAYREIEAIMDARLDVHLPDESFDPSEVSADRWIPAAASRCRELLGIRLSGPERIALLLERLGVRTLFFDFESKGLDGISVIQGDMSLIMLHRRGKAVERTITNAAHEFGHLVLHPHLFTVQAEEELANGRDYESEAKLFARHFLVPTDDLLRVWKDERLAHLHVEHALLLLKRVFHVSYWLLFHRLRDEALTPVEFPQLVARTKRLLGETGTARMEDLEPQPMQTEDIESSTRFHRLIRSAFLQEKIGVAKVGELFQITVDRAKEITFDWTAPKHESVVE